MRLILGFLRSALRPAATTRPALARRISLALVAFLVVTGLAVNTSATATAAPASASAATARASVMSMAPETYEKRVQHWVNRVRAKRGLRQLRVARCTDRVAERWTRHLAAGDLFFHQSMQSVLERCNARYAGETLGRGAITPKRLVRMWMESDGHRAILISPQPRRIGIGSVPDAWGRWVTTANFMTF